VAVQLTAGDLKFPVLVERLRGDNIPDDFGHVDKSEKTKWGAYCQRKGKIVSTGGRETQVGEQIRTLRTWRIWFRFDEETRNITGRMRAQFDAPGTVIANIEAAIDPNGDRKWIQLECIEEISG